MKHRKFKKGFTLIELVVVIAVIGILAGVSVATYFGVTNSAKESNDISLTKQMNLALQTGEITDRAETLGDAIKQVKELGGIDLEVITPNSKGYNYAWDRGSNRFLLLNDKYEIVAPQDTKDEVTTDTMIVVKTEKQFNDAIAANYGVGIAATFDGNKEILLNKNVSLDNYANVATSLTLNSSTALKINKRAKISNNNVYYAGIFDRMSLTSSTNVDIYGEIGTLELEANVSTTIYSTVNVLKVDSGKVEVGKEGSVSYVDASKATATSNLVINTSNGGIVGGVQAPEGNKDFVGGNTSGIVSDNKPVTDFAGGLGTENSPYLISTFEQLKKVSNYKGKNFKLLNDLTVKNDELVKVEWPNYNYYSYVCIETLNGTIDGDGHRIIFNKLSGDNSEEFASFIYNSINAKVKNLIVESGTITVDSDNSTFDNILIEGNIQFSNNCGAIICNASGTNIISNCINRARINSSSYSAVFVGYVFDGTKLVFENAKNEGTYIGQKSSLFVGNIVKVSNSLKIDIKNSGNGENGIVRSTCMDPINKYYWNCFVSTGFESEANRNKTEIKVNGKVVAKDFMISNGFVQGPNDTNLSLKVNEDKTFCVTKSSYDNVARYVISVKAYFSSVNGGGTYLQSVEESFDAFDTNTINTNVKYLNFTSKENYQRVGTIAGWEVVTDGTNDYYYFNDSQYNKVDNLKPSFVTVYTYDNNGLLLSTCDLNK